MPLIGQQPDDCGRAQSDEHDDGRHLDPGQHSLRLGEDPDRDHVEHEDQDDEGGRPHPYRNAREPPVHDDRRAGELTSQGDRPREPVQDGSDETRGRPQVLTGVDVESAGEGHRNAQLSQAQHDQVDDDGTDGVGQHGPQGAGLVDRVAGREEQSRADDPAEANHHEVTSVHAAFQRGDTPLVVGASRNLGAIVPGLRRRSG